MIICCLGVIFWGTYVIVVICCCCIGEVMIFIFGVVFVIVYGVIVGAV